jgi:hypothetical protein
MQIGMLTLRGVLRAAMICRREGGADTVCYGMCYANEGDDKVQKWMESNK